MKNLHLSLVAKDDLLHIENHSLHHFGVGQAITTMNAIDQAFQMLIEHPRLGHLRDDLDLTDKTLRFWTVMRRFVIVYRIAQNGIEIARVLDGPRDLQRALANEARRE